MNEKLNVCLVELVFHKAFMSPSSNLENLLFTISNEFNIIKGLSNNLDDFKNSKYEEHIIVHKGSNNGFLRILRYFYLQLRISVKLISLRKKINICIFFNENGLLLPIITSKLLGKKVLWQLPSSLKKMLYYNNDSFSFFLNIMQNLSYNLVDNIVLYSSNLIKEWELEKYRNKVLIAHEHTIDFKKFNIMKEYNKRDYMVGYVGRLSREKGVLNLVKSIKIILKQKDDLKFLIIGDGELRSVIEKYLKDNDLNRNVKIIKWVPHGELPSYFNELKLLVIPSYTEGLPNVMLEAMACGTPVLANNVGSIPDVVVDGKTGFIMKNNSARYVANDIEKILNSPKLNEISHHAYNLVKNQFSKDKTSKKWFDILQGEIHNE
jgi:glycosyltransferase involved in cell wall biosynthesis